jgi:hypothetical protein
LISRDLPRDITIGASPLAHARYLHNGAGKGYVTIGQKNGLKSPNDWHQHSYPLEKLYELVPAYSGLDDVYITQNRFYGSRRIDRLAELSALYADLDYYKRSELAGMRAEGVLDLSLEALLREQIPPPSLAMSTGRGLALVWPHEPVPGYVLSKWKRCQERIFEALRDLGADPAAKGAAQVLRLAGTYNSNSRTLVQSIFENLDYVWDFRDLADEILPLTQEQLEERRRAQRAAGRGPRIASERRQGTRNGFSLRTLHKNRLDDLKSLMWLRHGEEKLPRGQRDRWMFVAAVSLSYLVVPQFLESEIIALGRNYAGWSEGETRSGMHTVISRAHSAAAGEKVHWQGQQRDPRYRLTNQDIIARLEITSEEERHLKTIISEETKRERDRQRKECERRLQGAQPRDAYIANSRERRQHNRHEARKLHGEGKSLRQIGRALDISHTQVKRLLDSAGGE